MERKEFDHGLSLKRDWELLQSEGRPKALAALKDTPWFTPDKGTFLAPILGDALMRGEHYANLSATLSGRLFIYQDGYYRLGGDSHLRKRVADALGQKSLKRRFSEVLAWVETQTQRDPAEANRHGGLINLQNGMLAWEIGELLPHDPKHLSTIRIPVRYDPEATCPRISQFLEEVLPPDCIDTVLEFFGYALIPDVRLEKAFMFTGGGANGKSTCMLLLRALVGPSNVSHVALQDLGGNRFAAAQLEYKLLNTFADLPSRALRFTGVFKALVTGEPLEAERKHQQPFTLVNRARLTFSANRLPRSWDTSKAFFRRWVIIPFPRTFEGEDADTELLAKLTTPQELSGLLNLAIEGLRCLVQRGSFKTPPTAEQALRDYQIASDPIISFFGEQCTTTPEEGKRLVVGKTALYTAFKNYCESENLGRPESSIAFNKRFQELYPAAKEWRPQGGHRMWVGGIRLLPEYVKEPENYIEPLPEASSREAEHNDEIPF